MKPLVSILVPVYGVEKYISRCAKSLFEQSYDNIEYIFVDDCSPDKSIDILKKIIKEYPIRENQIKIIHHKYNKGLAGARNTAVEAASGQLVMHVDSDDWIERCTIEECVKKQEEDNYDIVSFEMIQEWGDRSGLVHIDNHADKESFLLKILSGNSPHNIWGHLIKRNLYLKYKLHEIEGINMGEDYTIIPILYFYAKKYCVIQKPFYHYSCNNSKSLVHSFSMITTIESWKAIDYVYKFFEDKGSKYKKAITKRYTQNAVSCIISSLRYGDYQKYKICCKRLKSIGYEELSSIKLRYRILVWLNFYVPRRIYLKIADSIWHFYKFHIKLVKK